MHYYQEVKIEEHVSDTTVPASSVCMPEDGMNAIATLRKAMYLVCYLYNFDFRMLVEEQRFKHGGALSTSLDFELADPP